MTISSTAAVAIGVSAGAVDALSVILPSLPRTFSLPIFIVVHVPPGKESSLPRLFQSRCALTVCEAEDKSPIHGGIVYFAPPDYHLLVEPDRHFSLSIEPPVLFSRPSIDVLFETAAEAFGSSLLGIVLTGANSDGAEGLRAIAQTGGTALVQLPDEAFAPEMPRAALAACKTACAMSLQQISGYLQSLGVDT